MTATKPMTKKQLLAKLQAKYGSKAGIEENPKAADKAEKAANLAERRALQARDKEIEQRLLELGGAAVSVLRAMVAGAGDASHMAIATEWLALHDEKAANFRQRRSLEGRAFSDRCRAYENIGFALRILASGDTWDEVADKLGL